MIAHNSGPCKLPVISYKSDDQIQVVRGYLSLLLPRNKENPWNKGLMWEVSSIFAWSTRVFAWCKMYEEKQGFTFETFCMVRK
jgi:hypothetical protein